MVCNKYGNLVSYTTNIDNNWKIEYVGLLKLKMYIMPSAPGNRCFKPDHPNQS